MATSNISSKMKRNIFILGFILTISLYTSLEIFVFRTTQLSRLVNFIYAQPKSISKYTKEEELEGKVYQYLKNVSEIHMEGYLVLINESLKTFEFPPSFDYDLMPRSWPALIPKELRVPLKNLFWEGFQLPLITGQPNGRLGNVMGEYATLFALGRLYNVTVLLHPDMKNVLIKSFPYLSMADLPDPLEETQFFGLHRQEKDYNYYPLELAAAGLFGPKLFMMHEYAFEIQLFDSIRTEIMMEYRFSDELIYKADAFLKSVEFNVRRSDNTTEITYVGFHIRRTDYLDHMIYFQGKIPSEKYFERALQYYRQKYALPIFIVSSDDRDFVGSSLNGNDIYIVPGQSADGDMSILTSCNHSIFTVGSYGFWTAYLTGGEVVYPDVHTNLSYCFSKSNYDKVKLYSFIPLDAY